MSSGVRHRSSQTSSSTQSFSAVVISSARSTPHPRGCGRTQSTMAWMSGRGVKYWLETRRYNFTAFVDELLQVWVVPGIKGIP